VKGFLLRTKGFLPDPSFFSRRARGEKNRKQVQTLHKPFTVAGVDVRSGIACGRDAARPSPPPSTSWKPQMDRRARLTNCGAYQGL
jgi:hypothetical protein